MKATAKPLRALTAAELMSRDVVLVPRQMSLREAARLLSRAGISGAPVVDEAGRCIGVLSATDFVRRAERGMADEPCDAPACVCAEWQVMDVEALPADAVGASMTADPVTAAPATPIGELARMMLDAHVHRVIVVDGERRPIGVVSSTDVLAAVARADAHPERP
jgi:CBS domain-containing membrane protein